MNGKEILNLGRQPLANGFLIEKEFKNEFFFNLKVKFDEDTKLVSLAEFVPPKLMFNENYAYDSSCSETMINHFKELAKTLDNHTNKKILEIGSNSGPFIFNFDPKDCICVEPCSNFAEITQRRGYKTYNNFWGIPLAEQLIEETGKFDVVYSANCMCHIQNINEAFRAINNVLDNAGIFIFEDPSLLEVIKNGSYDQFYDEHANIFSLISIKNLLEEAGLYIHWVQQLDTHGGSNRIYASKYRNRCELLEKLINIEYGYKLDKLETYQIFAERVKKSQSELVSLLIDLKRNGKRIIGYGATSKSTVVYNACNINSRIIDYVIDTTPAKQGKFIPGVHIPIVPPTTKIEADYAFLGAWNYKNEILSKERNRNFRFITHVPTVMIL